MNPQPTTRSRRVRFPRAVRVVPLEGPPRAFRLLAANLSREGMFVAAQAPFSPGTRVALSLEAGGRVLPFAQGEVIWQRDGAPAHPGPGFGVRFTDFLHPRARALVGYLVDTLDTGKPLVAAKGQAPRWRGWAAAFLGALAAGVLAVVAAFAVLRGSASAEAPRGAAGAPLSGADSLGGAENAGAPALEPKRAVAASGDTPRVPPPAIEAERGSTNAAPALEPKRAVASAGATALEAANAAVAQGSAEPPPGAAKRPSDPAARAVAQASPGGTAIAAEQPAPRGPPQPASTRLAVTTGAVRALTLTADERSLTVSPVLAPGARVLKAFVLEGPPRLVIDLSGPSPRVSQTLAIAGQPHAERARVGKLPRGTRLVLDLRGAAKLSSQRDGYRLTF